jgi:spermidine synthase
MPAHHEFQRIRFLLLSALFISGANGLVMEIVFRRQLLLSLGVSHYSVGTVLTVFMAGLALGSFVFGRAADRTAYPVRVYGLLEIGVGLAGLILTVLLPHLDPLYGRLYQTLGTEGSPGILLKSLLAGAVLLVPTIFMGGTLPVLGKAFAREGHTAGSPLGLLYGINTLGGVAGVLGSTFWLLGTLGAHVTLALISLANLIIGLICLTFLGKKVCLRPAAPAAEVPKTRAALRTSILKMPDAAILAVFFASGFAALSLEVNWTRILAYVVGSHGYAFGITLAAFLGGIALGSVIVSRFTDKLTHPVRWLGVTQVMIGITALGASLIMYHLRGLAGWLTLRAESSWSRFITMEMLILFLLLLIPALCMGAVFPLVMTSMTRHFKDLGQKVGVAYAWNTVGCILGALLAGFVLIPLLGISGNLKITVSISICAGAALIYRIPKTVVGKAIAPALGLGLVLGVVYTPLGYPLQSTSVDERLVFYDESSAATVAVREDGSGARMLSINGMDEVPVDPASLLTFRVLAHLPLLMHPDPQLAMVLSLGGAITTGSVARHPLQSIDAVELCPPVVRAAELFKSWNHGVLTDPRLNIIIQDGRNHLLTTAKAYDVITADATHPWSADSWILYTREMYQLVNSRLSENGVFCQWIPLHWMSPDDFKCILRTIRSVFSNVSLWYTGSYVTAVAANHPLVVDPATLAHRMGDENIAADLKSVGIDSPASLIGLFLMSEQEIDRFVGKGPLNTDDLAYLEHAAARCFGRETTPTNLAALLAARTPPTKLIAPEAPTDMPEFYGRVMRMHAARAKTIAARIATYEGRFADAVRQYQSALELAPEDGVTRMFLSDVQQTLAAAWASKGDLSRRSGAVAQALGEYRQALNLDSGSPRAHNGIGLIYYSQGDYRQAVQHFDIALNRLAGQVQIRHNRVLALLKLQRIDEARRDIEVIERLETGTSGNYSGQLKKLLPGTNPAQAEN